MQYAGFEVGASCLFRRYPSGRDSHSSHGGVYAFLFDVCPDVCCVADSVQVSYHEFGLRFYVVVGVGYAQSPAVFD